MGQVRAMLPHMFGYSYLSMFKWGYQAGLCLDLFRDDRYKTYREECVEYNESTKTSVAVSYLLVPKCDAKKNYNFYENFDGCEWFNMGANFTIFLVFFVAATVVFYRMNKSDKILADELPSEITENLHKYDDTKITHEDFDWKKAERYLLELNIKKNI